MVRRRRPGMAIRHKAGSGFGHRAIVTARCRVSLELCAKSTDPGGRGLSSGDGAGTRRNMETVTLMDVIVVMAVYGGAGLV